ncbi:MAG: hypothetical protein R3D71_04945 [Rickettsiales bacterium]
MSSPYLIIRRHLYEEPYHTQLEIIVSNGIFSGKIIIYVVVDDIKTIGQDLRKFPQKIGDECKFECGLTNHSDEDKWAYYFLLRAYTTDFSGHCAIQFIIDLNEKEPEEAMCKFSIVAESAAINRLGELLEQFSELNHMELQWNLEGGKLYESHQFSV